MNSLATQKKIKNWQIMVYEDLQGEISIGAVLLNLTNAMFQSWSYTNLH